MFIISYAHVIYGTFYVSANNIWIFRSKTIVSHLKCLHTLYILYAELFSVSGWSCMGKVRADACRYIVLRNYFKQGFILYSY